MITRSWTYGHDTLNRPSSNTTVQAGAGAWSSTVNITASLIKTIDLSTWKSVNFQQEN